MNEWAHVQLADVCASIDYGLTTSAKDSMVGPRFLRITDIVSGAIDWMSVPYCLASPKEIERFALRDGDIVVARTGASVGTTAFVQQPPDAVFASYLVRLQAIPEVDPRYLYYCLQTPEWRHHIDSVASGKSAQPNASASAMVKFRVSVPERGVQQAIAEVLGALDDRIESNRRCNRLSSDIAECEFQAALSEDGVAWDSAWPHKTLGDVLDVIETGSRPRGGVAGIASGVPSIGAESVVEAGHFDFGKLKHVPREFFDAMKRGRLHDRDVLLYKDGGRPGEFEPHVSMVGEGFPFAECAINEHVYRLRVAPPYSQDFLYFWLRSDRMSEEMRRRGTGVAIPGLNSSNVKALPMIVPDRARLARAQAVAEPLMTNLLKKAKHSRIIVKVRDALLPELLSGRLLVKEAEQVTGAVT